MTTLTRNRWTLTCAVLMLLAPAGAWAQDARLQLDNLSRLSTQATEVTDISLGSFAAPARRELSHWEGCGHCCHQGAHFRVDGRLRQELRVRSRRCLHRRRRADDSQAVDREMEQAGRDGEQEIAGARRDLLVARRRPVRGSGDSGCRAARAHRRQHRWPNRSVTPRGSARPARYSQPSL